MVVVLPRRQKRRPLIPKPRAFGSAPFPERLQESDAVTLESLLLQTEPLGVAAKPSARERKEDKGLNLVAFLGSSLLGARHRPLLAALSTKTFWFDDPTGLLASGVAPGPDALLRVWVRSVRTLSRNGFFGDSIFGSARGSVTW